jgi:hypothetical protein
MQPPKTHTFSDLLPSSRQYLLKFAESPKKAPPAGTKASKRELWGYISYSNHNILPPALKGSLPPHDAKCIQSIFMSPRSLNSFSSGQKVKFKVAFETQANS